MQAQGRAPRPGCPGAPRTHEAGRRRGKGSADPWKRLYGLPAPVFRRRRAPGRALAVAARV